MEHEPAVGYAISWEGKIDIKTVRGTRIGAITGWLEIYRRSVYLSPFESEYRATDDHIERLWNEYGTGATVVSVKAIHG